MKVIVSNGAIWQSVRWCVTCISPWKYTQVCLPVIFKVEVCEIVTERHQRIGGVIKPPIIPDDPLHRNWVILIWTVHHVHCHKKIYKKTYIAFLYATFPNYQNSVLKTWCQSEVHFKTFSNLWRSEFLTQILLLFVSLWRCEKKYKSKTSWGLEEGQNRGKNCVPVAIS